MYVLFSVLILLLGVNYSHADEVSPREKLEVGLILPLSGPLAEYGIAVQNGIELAKEHDKSINLVCNFYTEDSKYDSKVAVTAFNKLVKLNKVSTIYNWGGPTSEAVAPLADPNSVALFVWSADPAISENNKNVIRFCNSGREYAEVLSRYLKQQRYRKVGIVKTENQYIDTILSGLVATSGMDLQIEVVDTYLPIDQNFSSTITKIRNQNYDALGIFLLSGQVSNFAKKLKEQKLKLPIFGTDFFESMTEVKQANGGLDQAVFSNNEVTNQFRSEYIGRFKNDFQINHAANGYDFANFLCGSLRSRLSGISSEEILTEAANITEFSGEQGKTKFTLGTRGDKSFPFPVVLRKISQSGISTILATQ